MGIAVYDEVDSTNSVLLRQARDDSGEGAWALAKRQSGGRGRQGRAWASEPGNLHASTLVRLQPGDPPAPTLSLVAAVALHRAFVDATDIAASHLRIKWPNDLVVQSGETWDKIAGILLEREGDAIVAGFGANLAHAPDLAGRTVASAAEFGTAPEPLAFCFVLEHCFADELQRWRSRGAGDTSRRWLDRAHPLGTALTVHVAADETATGKFDGLEADGALRLAGPAGIRIIRAGDVSL